MPSATLKNKEGRIFHLVHDLAKAIRCCQQDDPFASGITFSQYCILDAAAKSGSLELAHLHELLAVEKSTTTRLVAPLLERELVVKVKSLEDQRAIMLRLTPHGKKIHERMREQVAMYVNFLDTRIPADKRETVYEALAIFSDALNGCCAGAYCK